MGISGQVGAGTGWGRAACARPRGIFRTNRRGKLRVDPLSGFAGRMPIQEPMGATDASPAYRSIFVSDVHLGSPLARCDRLLTFLEAATAEKALQLDQMKKQLARQANELHQLNSQSRSSLNNAEKAVGEMDRLKSSHQ